MRLRVEASDISAAVAVLSRIVEKRITIPVLGNILFQASGGILQMVSTDMEKEARASVKAEGEADYTIPAKLLNDALRGASGSADVTFDLDPVSRVVTVAFGRTKMKIPTLPSAEFPTFPVTDVGCDFTIPGADLAAILSSPMYAVDSSETVAPSREFTRGLYLHVAGNLLRCFAMDGKVMTFSDVAAPVEAAGMPGVIIPPKSAAEIIKICTGQPDVRVQVWDTKLFVAAGPVSLMTRLIAAQPAKYETHINPPSDFMFVIDREKFIAMIERVQIVADESDRTVYLEFKDKQIKASVQSRSIGDIEDTMDIEENFEAAVGFQIKQLLDTLKNIPSPTVHVAFKDHGTGAVVLPWSATGQIPGHFAMVMPLKPKWIK